ncbi:MAG: AsmA family protein, partial [Opitutaceae bacterium]
ARDFLSVVLHGVPLAWAKASTGDVALSGGNLRGELIAAARADGFAVRAKTPLTIDGLSVARADRPFVRDLNISFNPSADYTPQGWQTEVAAFTVKSGNATLLTLDGKAGQLRGKGEAAKVTARISGDIPAWLRQPVAQSSLALLSGEVTIDVLASIGLQQQLQAKIAVKNLAADSKMTTERLPAIFADLRADFAAGGKVTVHAPIIVERDERKSDLAFSGSLTSGKDKVSIDAQVTSENFVVDDAKILAALLPQEGKSTTVSPKPVPDKAPPWGGIVGTVAIAMKRVVYSDTYQVSDVKGELRLEGGQVKLAGMRAGLDQGGEVKLEGTVSFDSAVSNPYGLAASLTVREFNPAPLFRAISPNQPATVEGKFDVTSAFAGRAATVGDLAGAADGDFHLTSRGGNFRLPVSVVSKVETYGAIAATVARLGSLASALGGKNDRSVENIATKAEAVAALVKGFNPMAYDQLNVVIARDLARNTVLKDFTLIAPEIRLSGTGQATHRPGESILDEALAMEFKLRARGYNAELLNYLGVLEPQVDDLGYSLCTLPLKIRGTLRQPDTAELNERLTSLALEKTGVGDKAADVIQKLFGGGK